MIRILKRLFCMMAQYKKRLYLGIVLSMINNILGIVPIVCGVWVIKTILDDINGNTVLNQNFVFTLIGIIVGTILLRWLLAYIRATKQDKALLEACCEVTGKTQYEVVMEGINKVYAENKK